MYGVTADTLHMPAGSWDTLNREFRLANLIQEGLEHRIDLLASREGIEVSANKYRLTRAERRADIGLSVSYERDWNGFLPPCPLGDRRSEHSLELLQHQ